MAIDESRPFKPVNIAVLTVSDTRGPDEDTSGRLLAERVARDGHIPAGRAWVADEIAAIQAQVKAWIADPSVDVIISTGGTGLTGRDVTPEAIRPLFDKAIEGFEVVWHLTSFQSVGLSTMQSRACAGLARGKLVFCLPGSTSACRTAWDKIVRAQLDARTRPCNLATLRPRLREPSE